MKTITKQFGALGLLLLTLTFACKKDKKDPLLAPSVITAAMTDLTTTTATAGGAISSDGGATVTEAGVYYSLTNNQPVSTDSKVVSTSTSGTFSVNLTGLKPGSTYYLRAYAINSIGTGYGEVMTFMTGNAAPEAKNVIVTGEVRTGAELTAAYTYFDNESNAEGASTYKWYIANDTIGAEVTPISGATAKTYTLVSTDETKFIKVGVTPKATSGTTDGAEVKSKWYGPVGGETVTFTYNGHTVTYGVIKSSVTGRKWMDRNLGAPNTPTAYDDWANYGDLFQWGRGDDGHQLINRISATEASAVNDPPFAGPASADNPGINRFITTQWPQGNWLDHYNKNFWQSGSQVNNPCPSGWHVPSIDEWKNEDFGSNQQTAYSQLKLTSSGYRAFDTASISQYTAGFYWISNVVNDSDDPSHQYGYKYLIGPGGGLGGDVLGNGLAIRCVKDN